MHALRAISYCAPCRINCRASSVARLRRDPPSPHRFFEHRQEPPVVTALWAVFFFRRITEVPSSTGGRGRPPPLHTVYYTGRYAPPLYPPFPLLCTRILRLSLLYHKFLALSSTNSQDSCSRSLTFPDFSCKIKANNQEPCERRPCHELW